MAAQLLTVSEYARHRGCDEKAVRRALEDGRITRAGTGKRCIDPAVADIQWAQNTRARADSKRKPGPAAGTGESAAPAAPVPPAAPPDGYDSHRTRREKADADAAEVRALREAEKVILREPSERAAFDLFRAVRDDSMAAMDSAAAKVRGMTEVREITLVLKEELRRALGGVDEKMRRRFADLAAEARS